ncbi:hypothetical protein IMY05_003G0116200 [Salix suchowensis]|nr:hypothetical protein IMY05_003G0116200 [Salix suchowensis]
MLTGTSLWKTRGSFCVSFAVKFLFKFFGSYSPYCTGFFSSLTLFFFNFTTIGVFLFRESLQQLNGEGKGMEKRKRK